MYYPGHIQKAKRQIQNYMKSVDGVVELLDARIPLTSRAYEAERLFQNKQRIVVLNKSDLADTEITSMWKEHFRAQGSGVVEASLRSTDARNFIIREIVPLLKSRFYEKRFMVVGMPNVGKSTFINRLKGKKSLAVGNRPGITRGVQWINVSKSISVLDTPGILYSELRSRQVTTKLLAVGSLPYEKFDPLDAFEMVLSLIVERYGEVPLEDYLGEKFANGEEFVEKFCRRRNYLAKQGALDTTRGAHTFLREVAAGKAGRFSFEDPKSFYSTDSPETE
ncbi:MAG TPA: ribosome biogenesis GTPase YlqF [Mesotoga sp.]|jgi:ribosome biogenesis GTPase A|uniref:ribosome biogenesis GTPase YlqF n=1 Tax=unclassified Mesotoga TaxID=1184398 RepID=UPI000A921E0E|nr:MULTISPECIES: ribosome biogenesis GTPase YlqF [unclassified Mesotoga]MDD3460121.1 ribosome biogenesis GTPase YlqF [Mesotoga sp.]PXF34262.1 GTP-binding protein [Mesotoga sp. SC_NapDC]RAM59979.1 GTP-binding protein [Mesotoga sp. SC_4PWA21]HNU22722.1 ribosome biogenesis GTPase YlqF [Mesotoga sp.]